MSVDKSNAPNQILSWFEKMKTNYERQVLAMLKKFEAYSEKQQARLDSAHAQHIDQLTHSYQAQVEQLQQSNQQLLAHNCDYKQQISQQQKVIEQLNTRYDTVMNFLITEQQNQKPIRDIFTNDDALSSANNRVIEEHAVATAPPLDSTIQNQNVQPNLTPNSTHQPPGNSPLSDAETVYLDAVSHRDSQDHTTALDLFKQAALQGHAKAMGALGRAYFLAEGTDTDHTTGLAWLIKAAHADLPQAVARVEHFKATEPELYAEAITLAAQL